MTDEKHFKGTEKFSKDFDFQNLNEGEFCANCGWVKNLHDYARDKACPSVEHIGAGRHIGASNTKHISSLSAPVPKRLGNMEE